MRKLRSVCDNRFIWGLFSVEHVTDKLRNEALLANTEKVVELKLEFLELLKLAD